MLGFGTKTTQVFTSRWKAVSWSLGILLTAYCAVPSQEQTDQTNAAVTKAQQAHKSPWAR